MRSTPHGPPDGASPPARRKGAGVDACVDGGVPHWLHGVVDVPFGARRFAVSLLVLATALGCDRRAWVPIVQRGVAAPAQIPWLADGTPPVAPPQLTPCPSGWHEVVDDDGVRFCDAYDAAGPQTCADDAAHFPGEMACRRLGPACDPASPYAADLPTDRPVLYALATAAAGGDGTLDHPFASLTDAIAAAPDGALIALGQGRYDDAPIVELAIDIVGACVASTVIAPTRTTDRALVVRGASGRVTISNLTFSGASGGVEVVSGAHAIIHDVAFVDADGAALWVEADGHAMVRDALVRRSVAGRTLPGLIAGAVAEIDARRIVFDVLPGAAALASGTSSSLRLEDAAILGGASYVQATAGANVALARVWLSGASVQADDHGTLTAEDLVRVGPSPDPGMAVIDATMHLSRVRIEGSGGALSIYGTDGSLDGDDLLLRDLRGDVTGSPALRVVRGASATVGRIAAFRMVGAAIFASGPGTQLTVTDLHVRDSTTTDSWAAAGLDVLSGARALVQSAVFEHCAFEGIALIGESTRLEASDVVVRDVGSSDWGLGTGFDLIGGSAVIDRVLVDRSEGAGLSQNGAHVELHDAVLRDVRPADCPSPAECERGVGLSVASGDLVAARVRVERAASAGFSSAGSAVHLEDVAIVGTPRGVVSYDATLFTARIEIEGARVDVEAGWVGPR